MVQFEISVSEDEDEPPLFDAGDSRSTTITPFISDEDNLVAALYSAPVTEYVGPKAVVEIVEVHYSVLPLDFMVGTTIAEDGLSPLEMMLDDRKRTFDGAMVDYIFDPPSIESDEMADDRELMNDGQRALLPYLRRLLRGASESEYSTMRRYNSLGSLN